MKHSVKSTYSFDTQGHRGCRGLMPENTIATMIRAIDLGVTTVELDVVISKDNKVVVSHEPFFNHEISTTPTGDSIEESEERNYNLYQMDYDEIRQFDVGMKLHPRFTQQAKLHAIKPLLQDLIDSVENYTSTHHKPQVYYNIETKCLPETDNIFHPKPELFCELLMKVITDKKVEHRTIIQSFDIRTLQYIHKHYPHLQTSLLIDEDDQIDLTDHIKRLGFVPSVYSPHFSFVTSELITLCHKNHMKIIPWTVNDLEKMKQLKLLGVDGLISDYPNLYKLLYR